MCIPTKRCFTQQCYVAVCHVLEQAYIRCLCEFGVPKCGDQVVKLRTFNRLIWFELRGRILKALKSILDLD